jgi:hypothetical protein
MESLTFALVVAFVTFVGALVGMWTRGRLPEHHVDPDSKDVVKLAMGLVATMTALILGLVVSSTKAQFDAEDANVKESAANILSLDRALARYGDETAPIRAMIKRAMALRITQVWPDSGVTIESLDNAQMEHGVEGVMDRILTLTPTTDSQRWAQSQALQLMTTLQSNRWLMLEREGSGVAHPFLIVIVVWLTLIFASFGLFAPRHATSIAALAVGALSVAAAIFLILEMEHPYQGLIKVSSEPLQFALQHLGN